MITSEALRRHPAAFRSLTGYTPDQFDVLFADFAPAHRTRCRALTTTQKEGQPRQRKVGGGPRHRHDLQTRLLIALFWLRVYPTFEVLGFFFSLNKTNVHDAVNDMLATLATLAQFPFERPPAERKKRRSVAAVMEAFPDVRLVIDAKEQRIQRPQSSKENDRQRPYYSGKKKCHTLKTQVAVEPDGRIGAVSSSVPGGGIHDLVLLRLTRLMERLEPGEEAAMVDKAYEGLGKYYPEHTIYQPIKARKGRPLTEEEKAYNRKVSRCRIVVEHTNAQLNQYQVLSQVYRHGLPGHSQVVRAVAYLVDRRIQQRPLKSYSVA
jgi:DDE superfamily endonuclease